MKYQGGIILNIAKGIIIALLIIALTKQPYGYYQIMRIAVTALFAFLGYALWQTKGQLLSVLCYVSALIFQPFEKIALRKNQWHKLDLLFTGLLIVWVVIDVVLSFIRRSENKRKAARNLRKLQLMRKLYNRPEMTELEMLEKLQAVKAFKEAKEQKS